MIAIAIIHAKALELHHPMLVFQAMVATKEFL